MRPARGDYPCRVCGRILPSPGALGGHMSQHRARGELGLRPCMMCEQEPATTKWNGLDVCGPCGEWLTGLDADLRQTEQEQPEVAAAAADVEAAVDAWTTRMRCRGRHS